MLSSHELGSEKKPLTDPNAAENAELLAIESEAQSEDSDDSSAPQPSQIHQIRQKRNFEGNRLLGQTEEFKKLIAWITITKDQKAIENFLSKSGNQYYAIATSDRAAGPLFHNPDVNDSDDSERGFGPLMYAAKYLLDSDHIGIIRLLLSYASNLNARVKYSRNPLNHFTLAMIAASSGNINFLEELKNEAKERKIDFSTIVNPKILKVFAKKSTPLTCAMSADSILIATQKKLETIRWLLRNGADVNVRELHGISVLVFAIKYARDIELVKYILQFNPNLQSKNYQPGKYFSGIEDWIEATQFLRQNGDVDKAAAIDKLILGHLSLFPQPSLSAMPIEIGRATNASLSASLSLGSTSISHSVAESARRPVGRPSKGTKRRADRTTPAEGIKVRLRPKKQRRTEQSTVSTVVPTVSVSSSHSNSSRTALKLGEKLKKLGFTDFKIPSGINQEQFDSLNPELEDNYDFLKQQLAELKKPVILLQTNALCDEDTLLAAFAESKSTLGYAVCPKTGVRLYIEDYIPCQTAIKLKDELGLEKSRLGAVTAPRFTLPTVIKQEHLNLIRIHQFDDIPKSEFKRLIVNKSPSADHFAIAKPEITDVNIITAIYHMCREKNIAHVFKALFDKDMPLEEFEKIVEVPVKPLETKKAVQVAKTSSVQPKTTRPLSEPSSSSTEAKSIRVALAPKGAGKGPRLTLNQRVNQNYQYLNLPTAIFSTSAGHPSIHSSYSNSGSQTTGYNSITGHQNYGSHASSSYGFASSLEATSYRGPVYPGTPLNLTSNPLERPLSSQPAKVNFKSPMLRVDDLEEDESEQVDDFDNEQNVRSTNSRYQFGSAENPIEMDESEEEQEESDDEVDAEMTESQLSPKAKNYLGAGSRATFFGGGMGMMSGGNALQAKQKAEAKPEIKPQANSGSSLSEVTPALSHSTALGSSVNLYVASNSQIVIHHHHHTGSSLSTSIATPAPARAPAPVEQEADAEVVSWPTSVPETLLPRTANPFKDVVKSTAMWPMLSQGDSVSNQDELEDPFDTLNQPSPNFDFDGGIGYIKFR